MGKLGAATALDVADHAGSVAVEELLYTDQFRTVMICGSVRRRVEIVSDVDIVLETADPEVTDLTTIADRLPGWHWTPKGGLTSLDDVRIELYLSPPNCLGATVQFLTGPGDLNVYLRRKAKGRGYKLSQYGLLDGSDRIDATDGSAEDQERSIFEALGVPWMTPEERSTWRETVRGRG